MIRSGYLGSVPLPAPVQSGPCALCGEPQFTALDAGIHEMTWHPEAWQARQYAVAKSESPPTTDQIASELARWHASGE
jgi:hypothetical protein